jgi:hypothetical protein
MKTANLNDIRKIARTIVDPVLQEVTQEQTSFTKELIQARKDLQDARRVLQQVTSNRDKEVAKERRRVETLEGVKADVKDRFESMMSVVDVQLDAFRAQAENADKAAEAAKRSALKAEEEAKSCVETMQKANNAAAYSTKVIQDGIRKNEDLSAQIVKAHQEAKVALERIVKAQETRLEAYSDSVDLQGSRVLEEAQKAVQAAQNIAADLRKEMQALDQRFEAFKEAMRTLKG